HAQPVDVPVAGHERRGALVREQGVIFDERAPHVSQFITDDPSRGAHRSCVAPSSARTSGSAAPEKSNIAWFSQAFPELGSSGSQPAPSTAVQAGSQYTTPRSEEHTSELQSRFDLVCRL